MLALGSGESVIIRRWPPRPSNYGVGFLDSLVPHFLGAILHVDAPNRNSINSTPP